MDFGLAVEDAISVKRLLHVLDLEAIKDAEDAVRNVEIIVHWGSIVSSSRIEGSVTQTHQC